MVLIADTLQAVTDSTTRAADSTAVAKAITHEIAFGDLSVFTYPFVVLVLVVAAALFIKKEF